jgi:predicted transcriptional regulator
MKETVEKESGKKRPYMIAYVDTIEHAAKELKNGAFKVYIYLLTNQNDYYFGLSPQDIANRYGINIDTAREGIKQLIDKGYLVSSSGNEFTFYDKKPVELSEKIDIMNETRMFHTTKGEEVFYTYAEILDAFGVDEAKVIWERGTKQ